MSIETMGVEIPEGTDIGDLLYKTGNGLEALWDFLNTHPTPVKIATTVQSIFQSFR